MTLEPTSTIQEARDFVRENFAKGSTCPCCGQRVQKYRYPLFASSAYALIRLYRINKAVGGPAHISQFAEQSDENIRAPHFAELRFWGLVKPAENVPSDKKASGFWEITELGIKFVEGLATVPKYVNVFNNKFLGHEGAEVGIRQCLGNKFDYEALMKGTL